MEKDQATLKRLGIRYRILEENIAPLVALSRNSLF